MLDHTGRLSAKFGKRLDLRARRTRIALVEAFNRLLLSGRERSVGVRSVIAEAKVGRSTFYEHFENPDALHMEALSRPFSLLADAAVGRLDPPAMTPLIAHFWTNRRLARTTLDGRTGELARRLLVELVAERIADEELKVPHAIAAEQLAGAALSPLRPWLFGEYSATVDDVAVSIYQGGKALIAAMR